LLLLLLWLLASPVLALPLCVEFELRRDTTVAGQSTPGEPQKLRVVLADDYLEFEDRDGRVVHDFLSYQSHLVHGDDYVRRSLYADIGFRVAELRNRLELIQALEQTDVAAVAGEVVATEHLLAIDDEVSEANIVKTEGKTVSYSFEGKLLAEYSSSGKAITAAQSKALVRFLRYYCGGHPDILADLRARNQLPDSLRIDVTNVKETTSYQLRTVSAAECDPPRPDFSALRPTVLPPEPLGTLVALALQLSPQGLSNVRLAVSTRAQQTLEQGQFLESALRDFELLLMEGHEAPKALAESRQAFLADPDSKILFEALTIGQRDPKRAAALLEPLQKKAGPTAHVVKIFRAGFLLAQGELVQARNLYVEALMANPAIAGAWKDLGDIYHSNYEMDMAWLCWDVGRKLAPDHAMLQETTRLESALRSNYPGFF
jgi:hypothetical protein